MLGPSAEVPSEDFEKEPLSAIQDLLFFYKKEVRFVVSNNSNFFYWFRKRFFFAQVLRCIKNGKPPSTLREFSSETYLVLA